MKFSYKLNMSECSISVIVDKVLALKNENTISDFSLTLASLETVYKKIISYTRSELTQMRTDYHIKLAQFKEKFVNCSPKDPA